MIAEILAGLLFGGFAGFIAFKFYNKITKRRRENRALEKIKKQKLLFSEETEDGIKSLSFVPDTQLGELEPLQKGTNKTRKELKKGKGS